MRKLLTLTFAALIVVIVVAMVNPSPLYQLELDIDGQRYVTDYRMTRADCETVLRSTAHDPDSFRHGSGRYVCRRAV